MIKHSNTDPAMSQPVSDIKYLILRKCDSNLDINNLLYYCINIIFTVHNG